MENLYMLDAKFLDRKTIQLSEEYPVTDNEICLIIIPKKGLKSKKFVIDEKRTKERYYEPLKNKDELSSAFQKASEDTERMDAIREWSILDTEE